MGRNSFGTLFRITTFGESHGSMVGVVIDGCPAGLSLQQEEIQQELTRRTPGRLPWTSLRKEQDHVEITSGLFEGKTTGAPICLLIHNCDVQSQSYEVFSHLLKPGHAQYTYLQKYGIFDYKGGGRSSARETACRVAAGAIAKKLLQTLGITVTGHLQEIGQISCSTYDEQALKTSALFCPDPETEALMIDHLIATQQQGDSLSGIVHCLAEGVPPGLGDPVYEKLEAKLAFGMLSIPACKGIEFGNSFSPKQGSKHNDTFHMYKGKIALKTNHSQGILGGISTGMPLLFRVSFKPPSSISQTQTTCTVQGKEALLPPHPTARHDPCVAIRAVPVVEAMTALVLIDAYLLQHGHAAFSLKTHVNK